YLGIFTNVSKESDFDPEYVFEMSKVTIMYKPQIETTGFSSPITCHSFQTDRLRCFVHDIKYVTSINQISETSNQIEVGQWFEMKFMQNSRGIRDILVTEKKPTKLTKNFMKDIIHQFNIGPIGDIENANITHGFKKYGFIGREKTPIGKCISTYLTELRRFKKDAYEETNSSFQIRVLKGHFDQKDLHVYVKKFRSNCTYSSHFADFLGRGKVTKYDHIIELIDNKLQFITTLEVRSFYPGNSVGTPIFKETTQLNLIDVRFRR
ncbi:hypothetical protein ALC57_11517, partial [Trachymyrmex cornetzi]